MKKSLWLIVLIAVAVLSALPVFAAEKPGMPAPIQGAQEVNVAGSWWDGTGIWTSGFAGQNNYRETKNFVEEQSNRFGSGISVDKIVSPHVRLGGGFLYYLADANYKTSYRYYGSSGTDTNAFRGILTATYDSINLCESRKKGNYSPEAVRNQGINGWYVDGSVDFTQRNHHYREEWYEADETTMWVGKSDYYAQEYNAFVEAAYIYNFGKENTFHLTPYTSLEYDFTQTGVMKVKGYDTSDYKLKSEGSNDLEQGFGAKLAKSLVSKKAGTFIPYVNAEWLVAYLRDWDSHDDQRQGGQFGAGIIFLSKGRMTVSAGWDMIVRNRELDNTGSWKIRYDV